MKRRNWIQRRSLSTRHFRASSILPRVAPKSAQSGPISFEMLEGRRMLAAYLFVDYGDNFPGGTLATTQGAFRDVADDAVPGNKILGTDLRDSANGFAAATSLNIVAQAFTALERSQMLAVIQRAYLPLDVTVVELTAASQLTADGRNVAGATSMADVINTLRGGNAAFKDAYVFVGTFIVDPGGANQQIYTGGGGLSPNSPTLGVASDLASATNSHDDVAVVYSNGGISNNTLNNISHEAGHLFGLQHAITNVTPTASINLFHQAEIMSYRNTNNTTSSMFTRFPMIRGDDNSPAAPPNPVNYNDLSARVGQVTMYDQLRFDAGVGANPNFTFVSGTGAHDIISLTRNGANADVTIQAFADNSYLTPITVPGEADSTFSFSIPLTQTILLYAGDSDDRIVIVGDLGVAVQVDGMLGLDSLSIDGLGGASATYTPNGMAPTGVDLNISLGGSVAFGGTLVSFTDFETSSLVSLQNFGIANYVSPGGADNLILNSPIAGQSQISGTTNGTSLVPLRFFNIGSLNVDTGASEGAGAVDTILVNSLAALGLSGASISTGGSSDVLTVDGLNALPGSLTFDGQAGNDQIIGPNIANTWTINGSNAGVLNPSGVVFANVENLTGGSDRDNFDFQPLGALAGKVDGQADFDTLNFALWGSVQAALTGLGSGGGTNGFDGTAGIGSPLGNGFADMDRLVGSLAGTFDELRGIDGPAQWFYTSTTGTYVYQSQTFEYQNQEVLTGGTQIDRFTVKPLASSPLFINGNLPSVLPGDLLRVDLVGVANPQLIVTSPGNGLFTFDPPHQTLFYTSIERLDVFDYGDAPVSYGTTTASGARHRLGSNLKLGSYLDPEPNGQPSVLANKDDVTGTPDDEDGVVLPTNLVAEFRAAAIVNASAAAKLSAWIDFDGNGIFDAAEQIATDAAIVAGSNRIEFSVPDWAVAGNRMARFRLSTVAGLGPTGTADDGEVEDHRVSLVVLAPGTAVILDDPLAPGESQKMLFAAGTGEKDKLDVVPYADDNLAVFLDGTRIFGPTPSAPILRVGVLGGLENDHLIVDNQLAQSAEVYGGFGNDLIQTSAGDDFLDGGAGDDVIYGYNGKDLVFGQSGADVLYGMGSSDVILGGDDDDLIYGGGGRDLLIGGNGSDRLFGESGDDLVLGARTIYDASWISLRKLQSEWFSARSYDQRTSNLRNGVGPVLAGSGLSLAIGTTVLDDATADRLFGGGDRDWFLALNADDELPDLQNGEFVN